MVAITGESNIIKSCECCNVDLHAGEVLKEEHELPSTCLLPPPLPTSSMGGKSHKHGGRFKHKHHLVRFTNPLPEATKHHHGHHWSATASVSARIFVFFCIFDPRTQFSVVLPLDVCGASYFQASVYIRQRYSSFEWF